MSRAAHATGGGRSRLAGHLGAATEALGSVERQLWALAVLAAVLDVWLTFVGLQAGLQEGNPVVASLVGAAGIAALGLAKVAALGVGGVCRALRPQWGPWLSLGLALPWVVAVGINLGLLATV